ncbi:MAG: SusC/RagA family TonB-linked outer membrane protein, partial [Paludibacter sp.]
VLASHALQKKEVSGTVKDRNGLPIPGVSVVVKGTNVGIITDSDGKFTLQVAMDAKTLAFSFVGMKTLEIDLKNQKIIDVVMEDESTDVDEVVVVGYGTQKKASVIGSVDRVEIKQLKQPSRTISSSLAGRLAGIISVQSSGEPGYDEASFWIRGVNTFAGNSTPLVLVDGVQRSMDNIDPEEIADFTILKDATATAIYGVRGANGVVLITTKRGTSKKPSVNFKVENSFTRPLQLPEFVDGPTYMRLHNEANRNMGQIPLFSEDQIQNTEKGTDPYYYPNVNWMDELISPMATGQRSTLNVSGGTETVRYFVSGAFLNQNGMWKRFQENSYNNNTNLKRYNFRTNIDMDITKTTVVSLQIAGILEDRNYPGESAGTIFTWMLDTPPTKFPLRYPDSKKIAGIPYGQGRNPYQLLAYSGYSTEHHATMQANINLNQDLNFITKGLRLRGTFAFDSYTNANIKRAMSPRPYLIVPFGYDTEGNPILKDENGNYKYVDQEPSSASYSFNLNRTIPTPYT